MTLEVRADQAVFLPQHRHGHSGEGQVAAGDHETVLHPGGPVTPLTSWVERDLFDGDLAHRTSPNVVEDPHVLETDERGDDLNGIDVHGGADSLHTSRLKRLGASPADTRNP